MIGCTSEEIELLRNFQKLDQTEQVIFLKGVEAMGAGRISPEQMKDRVLATLDRYRAGEELTLEDLNAIGTP